MGWRSSAGLRLCDGGTPGSKTHAAVAPCVSEMISSVPLWFPLLYPSIAILMTTHTAGEGKKKRKEEQKEQEELTSRGGDSVVEGSGDELLRCNLGRVHLSGHLRLHTNEHHTPFDRSKGHC